MSLDADDDSEGYIFIAPKKGPGQYGPMIVDDRGELVWFRPLEGEKEYATDFKVQEYRGRPVLTWWEGRLVFHNGAGEYVILDDNYQQVKRVRAGNGYEGDLHEFLITPQDTALFTIYGPVHADLSAVGGSARGTVLDGIAQEVDIQSGEVIFEWHSLDHVGLEESYLRPSRSFSVPYDYFHINSIDVDQDGNLLISARNTWTVYKVDRNSGEIMWRLGGKKSDFEMGAGTRTAYQHDARRQPDGTLTIFDNGANPKVHAMSRGIVLGLDEQKMRAELVREYTHPGKRLLAANQGNLQVLPDGNVFIGWGSERVFSEYTRKGKMFLDATLPPGDDSYRAFRFPWKGRPKEAPSVVVRLSSGGEKVVYASWNGATELAGWRVLAGPGPSGLRPIGFVRRSGFETRIAVDTGEHYISLQALDGSGRVIGTSGKLALRS